MVYNGLGDAPSLLFLGDQGPHLHAHPFNGLFSGTTRVSRYQKSRTDSEWQWHQLGRIIRMQVCILLQTDNHASTPQISFL